MWFSLNTTILIQINIIVTYFIYFIKNKVYYYKTFHCKRVFKNNIIIIILLYSFYFIVKYYKINDSYLIIQWRNMNYYYLFLQYNYNITILIFIRMY